MKQVIAIPAFKDNYIWSIEHKTECILVDPGEAQPVFDYLSANQQTPIAILITHHHSDHTGAVTVLKQHYPNLTVYGPKNCPFKYIDIELSEDDQISFNNFELTLNILHVPGHTLDHIAYYDKENLFCGDTLFSAGCGRMFEGTPPIYTQSLNKLTALNDDIKIYCTHEYTQANIKFALSIEPNNQDLVAYQKKVAQLRDKNIPSLPSYLALEKRINPFLRTHLTQIQKTASQLINANIQSSTETFAALRQLKDNF